MNVMSAFLNGDLQEVYMSQPKGFQVKGKEHLVYKLKRILYELKQAPRCWNMTLDHLFKKDGICTNQK
uniref:Reverse transcriptase Ty1/copia-type domain-containing protein n=1 Tax=Amphimedon queenslandica TaxID=400682 RepID=A0A1X7TQL1_AMPQE